MGPMAGWVNAAALTSILAAVQTAGPEPPRFPAVPLMKKLPRAEFEKNVFVNCPFDPAYGSLLRPLLFTIVYFGFTPKIASERSDSAEQRIDKICEFISSSRYSIHDLSRLRSTRPGQFFRHNMPFELGLDYGSRT